MRLLRYFVLLALVLSGPVLAQTNTPESTVVQDDTGSSIDFNEQIEGIIASGQDKVRYTFEGESGQYVSITLESEDFDAYLYLYGPTGELVAEDDDSAGSLNSRIGPLALPANGTYTIGASSLSGNDTGSFRLKLDSVELHRIEYTQLYRGELTEDSTEQALVFNAEAEDTITISLESNDFDSYLTLSQTNPASELASDDDGGSGSNSRIGPYEITESGEYIITVSAYYNQDEFGEYTLVVSRVAKQVIAFDETVETVISGSNPLHFVFEGQADQVIDVDVSTDDQLDTRVTLQDPSSYSIAEDDDSGGRVDPALDEVMLPADGQYYIIVQPVVSRDVQTPITITLSHSDIPSLDSGSATVYLDSSFYSRLLHFEADDGEAIRLHFAIDSDEPVSPTIEVIQDGTNIAESYAYDIRHEYSFGFDVPDGGDVIVRITEYSGIDMAIEVTLERG